MPAIGPRVGGAHVEVNLQFDDSSLDAVGRRIQHQLAAIGQQNRKTYRAIGQSGVVAFRSMLGSILAGAPLIGSAMSAAAGSVTLLANSLSALAVSSAALLPAFTSLGIAGLTLSIGLNNFFAAVGEVDPKQLKLLLSTMPEQMAKAVLSTRALAQEMRAALFPKLFAGLASGIDKLRETDVIQRGLGKMADSLNGLARGVLDYANSAKGNSVINKFFENNAKVFAALSKAVVPFLDGFLRLTNALTPAALRLADSITRVAQSFSDTTQAEGYGGRVNFIMKRAQNTAGLLLRVFGNLGTALANVFGHTVGPTNTFLRTLIRVSGRFKEFTGSVKGQTQIRDWVRSSREVMEKFGETVRAVFKVVEKLADPAVIVSFLSTVEEAFKILGKLPLEKMVDSFLVLADAIRPISGFLLAVIAGGAAFNIFLGSLGAQLGGLVVDFKTLSNLGNPFGKIAGGAGKHAAEIGKFTTILKGLGTVLGKALKFAGIAGLAVYVGVLIAKSDKLKGKVKEAFQAFKDLAGPLKDAFNEVKTSLEPVTKSLGPVFDLMDKIATIGIGLVIDSITYAFKSLGNVIKGVGRILSGTIDFFTALFHLDGSGMLDAIKKIGSGIVPLLKGIFGLFVTFFAPARLFKIAGLAFKGLFGGLRAASPGITSFLGQFILKILRFFAGLAPKLLSLGGKGIVALGKAIAKNAPKVLAAAGRIVLGVLKWIGRLPGRLLTLGRTAIQRMAGAVSSETPVLLRLASRILSGIVGFIAKLPGRLLSLGKAAIGKLGGAIRSGVGKVTSAAGSIFKAIWTEIKSLPGDLLKLGKGMIGGLIDGILGKLGDLKDAAGKIGGAIKDFLPGSPVKAGPLVAWNHGAGATGGGRNVIDAITGGLKNTDPIRRAMADVTAAVATSLTPPAGRRQVAGAGASAGTVRPSEGSSEGHIYIGTMAPHNYGEFEKQMRAKKRLVALGGRP